MAINGVEFGEELSKNGFFQKDTIREREDRFQIYMTLLLKMAPYLDSNAVYIKDAVTNYFNYTARQGLTRISLVSGFQER